MDMINGIIPPEDGEVRWDKDGMCRLHWERYLCYKTASECQKKMHDYYKMMMDYHYKMCMHYLKGQSKPFMPLMSAPSVMPITSIPPTAPTVSISAGIPAIPSPQEEDSKQEPTA